MCSRTPTWARCRAVPVGFPPATRDSLRPPASFRRSSSTRSKADGGPQIGDACRVARVADRKRDGVFHPVVPYAIGVVRCRGQGILSGTQLTAERKRDFDDLASAARSELQLLQFGIGAVDIEPDAGPNHHANHGIGNGFAKTYPHF